MTSGATSAYLPSTSETAPAATTGTSNDHTTIIGIRVTAILHLVGGFFLVAWGGFAIAAKAYWSYFATPIWTGVVIFGMAGMIGVIASCNKGRRLMSAYQILSCICVAVAFSMFVLYIIIAARESSDDYKWNCRPGKQDLGDNEYCMHMGPRVWVDSLIACFAFYELVVSLCSTTYGSRFTSKTGRAPTPPPSGATHNGQVMVIQGGTVVYPGGFPQAQNQAMYIIQQAPSQPHPGPSQNEGYVSDEKY